MTDKPKYSFIIPAYNAETTIERSISSISQKMRDYEIIVAENGSRDSTSSTVERMIEKNPRIALIHTEKGVSVARNNGIKKATGKWIVFVDADDIWTASEESLNMLTGKYKESDLICCSYYKDGTLKEHDYKYSGQLITGEKLADVTSWMLKNPTKSMSVWAKIYNKTFLHDRELLFNEDLRVSEDSEFLVRCMLCSRAVTISKVPIYMYCSDSPSVIRSVDTTRTEGYIKALEQVKLDLEGSSKILQDAFIGFTAAHLNLIGVHDIFNCNMSMTWRERIARTKEVTEHSVIKTEIGKISGSMLLNINNMPALLFKMGLYSLGGAMCFLRSKGNALRQTARNERLDTTKK